MDLDTAQNNVVAKLPLLKQGDYEMWKLRIEQYFQVQDYALWDIIENGNSFNPVAGITTNADAILGENISLEDLNLKFLRSLPSEWNTHVVVWRNKPDLDTMSFDDLYNNFKIVEQEVKRTVTTSSSSGSQNMAFVSSPDSTNEVNTANIQVSTVSTPVSTVSTNDHTTNLSNVTVYAFLANHPNGSQLMHKDLEQIHDDDLEEMNLKWQLALLSMRSRRYYQRTGKKITINRSDTAGYDKSKVECFNCHKIGHFARECRTMIAIDGAGFDWSFMGDEEVSTNMALMTFSNLEFNKSEFDLATYKKGLAFVEEQLIFNKKNEVMFCDQIVVLKRDASFKDSEISALNIQREKLKKEKESNKIKIDNFENASKSLDKLIGSQITDKSRKGMGFESCNAIEPLPTGLFVPPTIDLSKSGLE
ncbi:ribonuclease H-like domain-containing protein, partial [Tanacetum coccineum]